MRKVLLFIYVVLMSVSAVALTKEELKKFREVTEGLEPMFKYNMHVALFKRNDSIFAVTNKGDVILKERQDCEIIFNSNFDFNGEDFGYIGPKESIDSISPLIVMDEESVYAVDIKGQIIAPKGKYLNIAPFIDGYSVVSDFNGNCSVVNTAFQLVLPMEKRDGSSIFIHHNIWIRSEEDNKWHMLDSMGNEVCSYDYVDWNVSTIDRFSERTFRMYMTNKNLGITIVKEGKKSGAIDRNGKIVVPLVNDEQISSLFFKHGAVYKSDNGLWFYEESVFDSSGKQVYKREDSKTFSYVANGKIKTEKMVRMGDGYVMNFGLYDLQGNKSDYLEVSDNLRWHLVQNEWILEDNRGKIVSGPYIDMMLKCDCPNKCIAPWRGEKAGDYFDVVDDGKSGLIDKTGRFVLPMNFSSCMVDGNALKATLIKGDIRYTAFYDFNGKEIHPMNLYRRKGYENFGWHYEGLDCTLDAYQKDGKWGLLDMDSKKVIVPFCLDDVLAFMHGVGVVKYKGRLYYINEKGEGLPEEVYLMKK